MHGEQTTTGAGAIENRARAPSGGATPNPLAESDGGAKRPSIVGFVDVVAKVVAQHQKEIKEERDSVEEFISHRRDPPRQSSMPRSLENASDPSTSWTTTVGPKHPWTKCEKLGQGSFGTVYKAIDSDGMFFAVKEVSMVENDERAQQAIAQLMQEIKLLSQFKHENVVQYFGTEQKHGKLYIFLELASNGSLASICKNINLHHSQISAYTRQILKGLKYLHEENTVHRDIKCANILVDTTGVCKVADFGMAKQMRSMDQTKSCKGSAYWMAPEVIDPKKVSGLPSDIWSLGCSIIEMATGSPPFGDLEWYQVLYTVGQGSTPPIPDILLETAKDFIKLCLDVNPAKRPTATELLNHPFVSLSQPSGEVSRSRQPITEDGSADFNEGSRWATAIMPWWLELTSID